ncbi:unnamed protein product [Rhizophagus irregularis]|uniref:RING-type domain-containing protein n=2 Tax=Rhizophagus irregularis TaxID=588596 RepID=A0A915Z086_9GLOM|nr:hypothetical protein RirG_201820 [Rhizophagus irregularis DAOM 197198w]CAB4402709.1 unnamed protein product [Rhizophagus irregularis]CAB4403785.1 unnamed protein product [Rhizophagus irregularis]CAB5356657.1 unnamed protein product [Rhizophagus irregularis]
METERVTFVREIEGYLNNKRCLYEAEGRREYLPLVDQALILIKNMKNVTTTETTIQQTQQSACNRPTFDRPSEKMYHYAEGEAIDCAICIEQVENNHAQVRLSCGHIYHLNCLGSHFNHSGDYKCPYCRIEVDKYAKQPRIWEHPVNGPPQTQNQIDAADMPHPGELDFANFQRGVLQVVNSLFGGRLNLGHPFRNDNGTEEDYYDNDDDSPSENDDPIYDPRYVGSNDSESSDDSDESDDDHEYDHDSNIGFRSQRNSYYSSSNEALSSSARRTNPRLSMDSTIRTRSISRNRPRPDSMSRPSRPSSFVPDTTPRSEVNEMSRHASTSSRLRNMYQDGSTTDDLMDGESDSSNSSSEDSDDDDEVMFTGSFNWDASNDMDTSDDDDDSESENESYRRNFSHRSSLSSISPVSSDDEEENENDNESIVTTSTNNSRPDQQWYKPWSWYNNDTSTLNQTTTRTSNISASDTDATISSGDDDFE